MRDIKKEITMTQEDKEELLLKDLSARLPYHPIIFGKHDIACNEGPLGGITSSGIMFITGGGTHCHYFFKEVKPYLRPMSSMTDKEKDEFYNNGSGNVDNRTDYKGLFFRNNFVPFEDINYAIAWLNAHHFDYRGLIEKGLAIKAPKGMYT
jgi:hypothetical protein